MKTVLVILILLMVGCTNTSVVRVVEAGGGGAVGVVTGDIGSCAVHQTKNGEVFANVTLEYIGSKCSVKIEVPK